MCNYVCIMWHFKLKRILKSPYKALQEDSLTTSNNCKLYDLHPPPTVGRQFKEASFTCQDSTTTTITKNAGLTTIMLQIKTVDGSS